MNRYMKRKDSLQNLVISILAVMITIAIILPFGAHYFDLNDDVLMKDILSGSYLGRPDAHNIQMLYPLSVIFSSMYRIIKSFDWYGFFLCAAQYFSLWLIFCKSISLCGKLPHKIILALFEVFFFAGFMATHLLLVQYTFTCGLLACTAAFLLLLHKNTDSEKDLNLPVAAILILIAFSLRTEMLLLLSPFLLAAGTFRFFAVQDNAGKKTLIKEYFLYGGITVLGVLSLLLLNGMAYSSPDWKEFLVFFDARTELYDFQAIPSYEENQAFYNNLGLRKSEQALLENYNFGLDERIDSDLLRKLSAYHADHIKEGTTHWNKLRDAIIVYLYRLRHFSLQGTYAYPGTDFPWNICLFFLYLGVFVACLLPKQEPKIRKIVALLLLCVLFAGRSAVWIFIILRSRDPIRITHPLYLVEIVILSLLYFLRIRELWQGNTLSWKIRSFCFILPLCLMVTALISLPNQLSLIHEEYLAREETNAKYELLQAYFADHRDEFYLLDVYTSVYYHENDQISKATYSQRIFPRGLKEASNYDLLGGWACKSPLSNAKIRGLGFPSMEEAFLSDHILLVQDLGRDTDWIIRYYQDKGISVTLSKIDEVAGVFGIYRLQEIVL